MAHPNTASQNRIHSSRGEEFAFATCFPASNAWLRRDVGRRHPGMRLAFSAPGLVTWKAAASSDASISSPLAIVSGVGLGRAAAAEEAVRLAVACATKLQERGPVALHVYHTARDVESTEEPDETLASWLDIELSLRNIYPFLSGSARVGAPIIDVIHLRDKPGSYFVGWHIQRGDRPAAVGGVAPKPLDPRAPSRAYSKAWELLRLGELDLKPGEIVVELGAAPGGGTIAWLEQRAAVTAIDPAEMSSSVAEVARLSGADYQHVRKSAGDVDKGDLPKRVDYLYSDMNLAPAVVLRYVERACALCGTPKRAVLMNLKVNDTKVEDNLGALLERVAIVARRLACEMLVAQLPSHRKEIGVVLRRRQSARAKGNKPRK